MADVRAMLSGDHGVSGQTEVDSRIGLWRNIGLVELRPHEAFFVSMRVLLGTRDNMGLRTNFPLGLSPLFWLHSALGFLPI